MLLSNINIQPNQIMMDANANLDDGIEHDIDL